MNDADLRIGDAERERAAAELGEHYAQGRLDTDEHAERLDRIWAARTRRELGPVFADLPGGHGPAPAVTRTTPWTAPRVPSASTRRRTPGWPFPLLPLLVVLAVVGIVTHLPFILIGLGVWFLFARKGCGPRVHRIHGR